MVQGVTAGYEKRLEIQGVGYRAQLKGKNLELAVGYSHPVPIPAPDGHRIRGAPADPRRRQGHLQAARGRDRRDHPQAAPARALQGQGHPLRGRVRRPARWASAHDRHHQGRPPPQAPPPRAREDLRHRRRGPRISVFRSNRGLSAQLVDDVSGHTLAAVNWFEPELRTLAKAERAKRAGALLAERAKAAGVSRSRVRPRRLPLPRPRARLRRGDPRGRARPSSVPPVHRPLPSPPAMSITRRSLSQPVRPGPPGARRRDQPRRQGRQGRPALLVHRPGRGGRRTRRRGRRLRQGQRGAAGDPEGRRAGQEGPLPRAQARLAPSPTRRPAYSAPAGCS